jgi:hypothetical protein
MITARTLGQQVLDRLKKFTTDSDITLNDAILAVQQALSDLVSKRNLAGISFDGSLYHYFVDIPIVDGKVVLPATPMSHAQAIEVSKSIGSKPYTRLPHGFTSFQNLAAASIGGEIGYFVIGNELHFPENLFGLEPPSAVVLKLLCPILGANSDAYFMIPADLQQTVIDTVLQRLGATDQLPADETKDDVDAKA